MFNVLLKNYVIVDLETTGLDPDNNDIIEVGAINVVNDVVCDTFVSFVSPRKSVPPKATAINGITNNMLINAPDVLSVLFYLRHFVGDKIVVGHNIGFDMSFINSRVNTFSGIKCFDTKVFAKLVLGNKLEGGFSQLNLEKYFNIVNDNKHRAIGDCMALFKIFSCLKGMLYDGHDVHKDNILKPFITNNGLIKSNYNAII